MLSLKDICESSRPVRRWSAMEIPSEIKEESTGIEAIKRCVNFPGLAKCNQGYSAGLPMLSLVKAGWMNWIELKQKKKERKLEHNITCIKKYHKGIKIKQINKTAIIYSKAISLLFSGAEKDVSKFRLQYHPLSKTAIGALDIWKSVHLSF